MQFALPTNTRHFSISNGATEMNKIKDLPLQSLHSHLIGSYLIEF